MNELGSIDDDVVRSILAQNADGIMITDADNHIVCMNQSFATIYGYDEHELIGKTPSIFKSGQHDSKFYRQLWVELHGTGVWKGELVDRRKDGTLINIQATITAICFPGTKIIKNYVLIARDVTQIKQYEEELRQLAFHDPLTGMYNRRIFFQFLDEHIAHLKRTGTGYILSMIDLDNFGDINTKYGHNGGDIILKHVADSMKCVFKRDQDISARLGGDEFVVLLTGIDPGTDCNKLCQDICKSFIQQINEPFAFGEYESVRITASVGIVVGTADIRDSIHIMDLADKAMYKAKHSGKNNYVIYDSML